MKVLIITSKTGETKGLYKITQEHIKLITKLDTKIMVETAVETDAGVEKKLLDADILITSEFGMLNSQNSLNLKGKMSNLIDKKLGY